MPNASSRSPLEVGTIVDGHRITAMRSADDDSCIVYEAIETRLERAVALTEVYPLGVVARAADGLTLTPTSTENAERLRRGLELFQRDVRALSQLSTSNIAAPYSYIPLHGTIYATGELLDGSTIGEMVRERGGRISEDDVALLGLSILEPLSRAHDAGVLHGNVAPENIWVARRNRVVLSNFFDARRAWLDVAEIEVALAASPFTAPELISGDERGAFTDVYGAAATLYWCVTGRAPARASRRLLKAETIARPRELIPNIGTAFEDVLLRALSLRTNERFATAQEFLDALREAWHHPNRGVVLGAGPAARDAVDRAAPIVRGIVEPSAVSLNTIEPAAGDSMPAGESGPRIVDENVQFTVYRPAVVRPAEWNTLLAFAHLSEARPGSNDPDPVEQVERQAIQILERRREDYGKVVQDSAQSVPREGTLTFAPHIDGVEFNPPQRSFQWVEDVHREEFRFRASPTLDGRVARGRMTVYHGAIILAEIALSIRVDAGFQSTTTTTQSEPAHAKPFRRIFASYSHKDLEIVRQFERFATTLGDRYLRDWNELRAGEAWNDRLMELIGEADVFQLFWSRNAMASPFVRREWEYALSLARANFVRPTYWEEPMPATPDGALPSDELKRLHFQKIAIATPDAAPPEPPQPSRAAPAVPNYDRSPSVRHHHPNPPPLFPNADSHRDPTRSASVGASHFSENTGPMTPSAQAPSFAPPPAPRTAANSSAPRTPSSMRLILTIVIVAMLISAILFAIRTFH